MAFSYYIYYRIARAEAAQQAVGQLQSALNARFGIPGRLLCKRGEPALWMEVYEGVEDGDAFEAEMARRLLALDFDRHLVPGSKRQVECFEQMPCA